MVKKYIILIIFSYTIYFVFLALLLSLNGCQGSQQKADSSHKGGQPSKIVYRLKWLFNASTVGDLWARDMEFFAEKGLNVIVKEGGAEHDAIEEIELKRAAFGIASADQVIRAASKGADVIVIAQIFQKNPLQWIYRKGLVTINPVNPASSLKKLTIGITYGGNDEAIFMALARKLGLNPETLHLYAITYDYTPFWKGEVDLWPCYRNTQGISLQEKILKMGEKAGFFNPSLYGIRFVANSLITSKNYAQNNPKTVKLFREALLKGWVQAIKPENHEKAARLLSKYENTLPFDTIIKQIAATAQFIIPKNGQKIGSIDLKAWEQTAEVMYQQKLIKKKVDVKKLIWSPATGLTH